MDLRFRQVHLDFHTSPDIPGVGEQFDPDAFAETLQAARVDSISCFARCHHGIRMPVYTTVQWDDHTAKYHPEWLCMGEKGGEVNWYNLYDPGFYRFLCIRHFSLDCGIFYNSSHIGPVIRPRLQAHYHLELESLPSGGWGYMHFPCTVRYARTLGLDCLGMTGKFHTSWGDFHSFKNREALEFECFHMLALNAKCMIGAAQMLMEACHQFDVIDSRSDFSAYRLLILPDNIPVSEELRIKLERFIAGGGSLIATFQSGMDESHTSFRLDLGISLMESQTLDVHGEPVAGREFERDAYADFLLPGESIGKGLPSTEHVMYRKGVEVEALPESEVLAEAVLPFFNRTYKQFSSHRQAPSSGIRGHQMVEVR